MSNLAYGIVILKFNSFVLVRKSSSIYNNFILNLYIVHELNNSTLDPANNFPLKKSLFGIVKLVRNAMNRKFTYNGQGIAFEGSCSFGNEFARNVAIFGVNNS